MADFANYPRTTKATDPGEYECGEKLMSTRINALHLTCSEPQLSSDVA